MTPQKLPVFLTVDTEIWPYVRGWPATPLAPHEKNLARQYSHCILGTSTEGELGIRYQMARLNEYRLRATFFVEALHAAVVGDEWLSETVGMIQQAGHDVQMHAHPEWLSGALDPALPPQHGQFLWQYTLSEQTRILDWTKQQLERIGVKNVAAFRAGSFGANSDTLLALAEIGVRVDSSYHKCYLGEACLIEAPGNLYQRRTLGDIVEIPMTVFSDYPGHFRPMQLTACSSAEIENTLMQAWRRGWSSFVILWHGQEMLHSHFATLNGQGRASRIVIRRFERLCQFLADNADKFETVSFGDVARGDIVQSEDTLPLKSSPMLTAHRLVEQAFARYL